MSGAFLDPYVVVQEIIYRQKIFQPVINEPLFGKESNALRAHSTEKEVKVQVALSCCWAPPRKSWLGPNGKWLFLANSLGQIISGSKKQRSFPCSKPADQKVSMSESFSFSEGTVQLWVTELCDESS